MEKLGAAGFRLAALLISLLVCHPRGLQGAALKPTRVLGESEVLFKIQHIAVDGDRIVVLTATEPAVHLFSGKATAEWGRNGQGPGEVENPSAVLIDGQEIVVVDGSANRGRVIRYAVGGRVLSEQILDKPPIIGLLQKCGDSLLIQGGDLGGANSIVVRLGSMKEVLQLRSDRSTRITIRPKQGPSSETLLPGAASPKWSCFSDGRVAYWDGASSELEILSLDGKRLAGLSLPKDRIRFEEEDKAAWLLRRWPKESEFRGERDFFRHVRKEAASVLPFPKEFPALERLVPDPLGGVWALRAGKHSGQIWTLLREREPPRTVTFPRGRNVHAFGDTYVAAKVVDDLGVETVELYRRRDVLPEETRASATKRGGR